MYKFYPEIEIIFVQFVLLTFLSCAICTTTPLLFLYNLSIDFFFWYDIITIIINKRGKRMEQTVRTKQTLIRNYRKYSGADSYIIGYIYKKKLFMTKVNEIMPRFMVVSNSDTRGQSLRLYLNNKLKEQLLKQNAILLGNQEILDNGEKNRGWAFEKIIYDYYKINPYKGKDNKGFWLGGDINIKGEEIQIKFENATMCSTSTLEKLKKGAQKKYKNF